MTGQAAALFPAVRTLSHLALAFFSMAWSLARAISSGVGMMFAMLRLYPQSSSHFNCLIKTGLSQSQKGSFVLGQHNVLANGGAIAISGHVASSGAVKVTV